MPLVVSVSNVLTRDVPLPPLPVTAGVLTQPAPFEFAVDKRTRSTDLKRKG